MTSVVPKTKLNLAVADAEEAKVWIEEVKKDVASEEVSQGKEATYEKTPSKFDRSEPNFGELPLVKSPEVWTGELANGMKLYGIENNELPLVSFDITIPGGHLLDPIDKSGVSSFMTSMLMEGTINKTSAELEEAIGLLGATINMNSSTEEIRITASCLAKNFDKTLALVEEILLEPRWDEKEFIRLKQALKTSLKGREASPRAIASINFNKLIYGDNTILGLPNSGTLESVDNITLEDLKAHYNNLAPRKASFHITGSITKTSAEKSLSSLATKWNKEGVAIPEITISQKDKTDQLYFIDVPGSKQSVIFIGKLALSATNPEFNNLAYANEILGGGSSGRLFQTLRIQKGYTYGAYSGIRPLQHIAPFIVATSVRSNATLPSLKIIEEMITTYGENFDEDDTETTKTKILKGSTRDYEGLNDKLNILREMSKYNKPASYIEEDQKELVGMSELDFKSIIEKYITENNMIYVVVGDKATQFEEVKKLNKVVTELDINGNRI